MAKNDEEKELKLSEETLEAAYRELMPQWPDPEVEMSAEPVYELIKGAQNFLELESAINGYTAATEKRGFKEGLQAGLRMVFEHEVLKVRPRVIH
mgnify:CR=1 FL=1